MNFSNIQHDIKDAINTVVLTTGKLDDALGVKDIVQTQTNQLLQSIAVLKSVPFTGRTIEGLSLEEKEASIELYLHLVETYKSKTKDIFEVAAVVNELGFAKVTTRSGLQILLEGFAKRVDDDCDPSWWVKLKAFFGRKPESNLDKVYKIFNTNPDNPQITERSLLNG
ncbi:MAG: hypothetical protein [Bacteriophage sp.]|nr:MAG: hypothetical protein [Bacteriophage sp.]